MTGSSIPVSITSARNQSFESGLHNRASELSQTDSTPEDVSLNEMHQGQGTSSLPGRLRQLFSCVTLCMREQPQMVHTNTQTDLRNPQPVAAQAQATLSAQALGTLLRDHQQSVKSSQGPSASGSQLRLGAVHGRPSGQSLAQSTAGSTAQTAIGTANPQATLHAKERAMLKYAARGDLINLRISSELYPNEFVNLRDIHGNTLLHLAAASDNVNAAVFCLFKLGLELESRNNQGRTPLLMAAAHGRNETVDMLLDWGANILAHDKNRQSVFMLAVLHCTPETYTKLERRLEHMLMAHSRQPRQDVQQAATPRH